MEPVKVSEFLTVLGETYFVQKLLGKGKGGYSYLVIGAGGKKYVLKQIHHEPCDYYEFPPDKLGCEVRSYARLVELGIPMPKLLKVDLAEDRLLKEYIPGYTVDFLVKRNAMKPEYYDQIRDMCRRLYDAGLNIDYYPTNFVVRHSGKLYYIDYECNGYMDQWNFENWGSKYWYRTPEFEEAFQ